MASYYVLGMEIFIFAEIKGIHDDKKIALQQAEYLENNKKHYCCQKYVVMNLTQIKKEKLKLY